MRISALHPLAAALQWARWQRYADAQDDAEVQAQQTSALRQAWPESGVAVRARMLPNPAKGSRSYLAELRIRKRNASYRPSSSPSMNLADRVTELAQALPYTPGEDADRSAGTVHFAARRARMNFSRQLQRQINDDL